MKLFVSWSCADSLPIVRCPCNAESTSERWLRRWVSVPVLRSEVSAQKQVGVFRYPSFDALVDVIAGMYALRERRQHVTQEDFEFAVAKVRQSFSQREASYLACFIGFEEEPRRQHLGQQALLVVQILSPFIVLILLHSPLISIRCVDVND